MAQTAAERQRALRERRVSRVAALESEVAALGHRLGTAEAGQAAAVAECERLSAEIAAAPAARCGRCGSGLACPACYRSDDF